jgi:hypothetical protein
VLWRLDRVEGFFALAIFLPLEELMAEFHERDQ